MANHAEFDAFVETIAKLRAPDGCPWDREQTHASIAHNMIEEAYEAVDAIEACDVAHLREELGDVLLQVVLQSQIAADAGEFTIDDVCRDINEKMVRRHPHIFGEVQSLTPEEVTDIWDAVKMREREAAMGETADAEKPDGLLDGIAHRNAQLRRELEFGDILFALVNVARWNGVDAENALRATCAKFRRRWSFMEGAAWARGERLEDLSTDEQEELWQQAKAHEREVAEAREA